jgi:hypothetical protein
MDLAGLGLFKPVSRGLRSVAGVRVLVSCLLIAVLGGCSAVVSSLSADMGEGLSDAILNQDDPELVREALPSYLLILDSLVASNNSNAATLSTAAQLYAAYGAAMVVDQDRARILTTRAKDYGERALCASRESTCKLNGIVFDEYVTLIQTTEDDDVQALYSYSLSSLAWIRANSDDFGALADLPKIEATLEHLLTLDSAEYAADIYMYLGILKTLRSPALGGKPEEGRVAFEKGIEISAGRNLSIKVEYARGYARLLYERELHDRLLNEVLAADVKQQDLTLFNILAQEEAAVLLASADDYF